MRYERTVKEHKGKIITELVEFFGCHRKAAIRHCIHHLQPARWCADVPRNMIPKGY